MYQDRTLEEGATPGTVVALTEVEGPCIVQLTDMQTQDPLTINVPDPQKHAASQDRKPGPLIPELISRQVGAIITITTLKGVTRQFRIDSIERRGRAS